MQDTLSQVYDERGNLYKLPPYVLADPTNLIDAPPAKGEADDAQSERCAPPLRPEHVPSGMGDSNGEHRGAPPPHIVVSP